MSLKDGAGSSDSIYSRLSTSELEDSLRFAILSEGEADVEYIIGLAKELERRGTLNPKLTTEESLKVFYEKYSGKGSPYSDCVPDPEEPSDQTTDYAVPFRRHPAMRVALVAAIVVVLIFGTMIVAQAAGLDVFGVIARWTSDVFSFSGDAIESFSEDNIPDYTKEGNDELASSGSTDDSRASEFATMEDALKAYGIKTQITPTWVPEGFEMAELEASEFVNWTLVQATYINGDSTLHVSVNIAELADTIYEKTDADVQIFNHDGTDYYLLENNTTNLAVWYTEGCECSISGQVSTEDLIKMLESIIG